MDKREKTSLILNSIIFVLMVVGAIMTFGEILIVDVPLHEHGIKTLKFFTVQSNIFGGIISLIYVIFLVRQAKHNKKMPHSVQVLKFIATVDLVITFLVVALFLGFVVEEGYFSVFVNANFLFHFVIPVLSFISFTFFEDFPDCKKKHIIFGLLHLIAYSIFYLTVVITHFQDGKVDLQYDWYGFAQLGLPIAFVFAVVLLAIGYFVAILIKRIQQAYTEKYN